MAVSGMAGLLKSMGVDADQIQTNIELFTAGMKAQAETINANQVRLEAQGARIETKLNQVLDRLDAMDPGGDPRTREVFENGKPTGVLITNEKFPQALIDDVNKGGASDGPGDSNRKD